MRNNKMMSLMMVGLISASMLVGCSSEEVAEVENVTIESTEEFEKTEKEMNLVLMDNEICKVTVLNGYKDEMWGTFGFKVLVENKSDQDISVMMMDTSVNGFMEEPVFCVNVTAGNKGEGTMEFYKDETGAESLEELVNIKSKLYVCETVEFNTIAENQIVINEQ